MKAALASQAERMRAALDEPMVINDEKRRDHVQLRRDDLASRAIQHRRTRSSALTMRSMPRNIRVSNRVWPVAQPAAQALALKRTVNFSVVCDSNTHGARHKSQLFWNKVGRTPGPRPTPSSAFGFSTPAGPGAQRGRGRPPHLMCNLCDALRGVRLQRKREHALPHGPAKSQISRTQREALRSRSPLRAHSEFQRSARFNLHFVTPCGAKAAPVAFAIASLFRFFPSRASGSGDLRGR